MSGGRFISQIDKNAVKVILATLILIGIDVYFLFTGFSGKSGRFWILLIVNFISIFILSSHLQRIYLRIKLRILQNKKGATESERAMRKEEIDTVENKIDFMEKIESGKIFIINPDTGIVGVEKNGVIEDLNKKQREYYANMMKFQDIDKKKIWKNRKYYTRENEITHEARFGYKVTKGKNKSMEK